MPCVIESLPLHYLAVSDVSLPLVVVTLRCLELSLSLLLNPVVVPNCIMTPSGGLLETMTTWCWVVGLQVVTDGERELLEDKFSGRLIPHAFWLEEEEERKRAIERGRVGEEGEGGRGEHMKENERVGDSGSERGSTGKGRGKERGRRGKKERGAEAPGSDSGSVLGTGSEAKGEIGRGDKKEKKGKKSSTEGVELGSSRGGKTGKGHVVTIVAEEGEERGEGEGEKGGAAAGKRGGKDVRGSPGGVLNGKNSHHHDGHRHKHHHNQHSSHGTVPLRERTLVEIFERQARLTPDAPVLLIPTVNPNPNPNPNPTLYPGQPTPASAHADTADSKGLGFSTITYSQLHRRARLIARFICKKLPRPSLKEADDGGEREEGGRSVCRREVQLVGLCVERGVDWLAGMIGILMAGRAYVPMDPSLPSPLLEEIVTETHMQLVIGTKETSEQLLALKMVDGRRNGEGGGTGTEHRGGGRSSKSGGRRVAVWTVGEIVEGEEGEEKAERMLMGDWGREGKEGEGEAEEITGAIKARGSGTCCVLYSVTAETGEKGAGLCTLFIFFEILGICCNLCCKATRVRGSMG